LPRIVSLSRIIFAGFVDSIAGGGGLIQLPALLIGLPKSGTAEVLGTNKLSAVLERRRQPPFIESRLNLTLRFCSEWVYLPF
jgi:hypothetical protein